MIEYKVKIRTDSDGSMWARIDEVPGCFASGFSFGELLDGLTEALELCTGQSLTLNGISMHPKAPVTPALGFDGESSEDDYGQEMLLAVG